MGLFTYAGEPKSARFSLGGEVSCITVSAMFTLLKSCYVSGAPNENIVQNNLNIALLNVF